MVMFLHPFRNVTIFQNSEVMNIAIYSPAVVYPREKTERNETKTHTPNLAFLFIGIHFPFNWPDLVYLFLCYVLEV